jgi:hypothetical protein
VEVTGLEGYEHQLLLRQAIPDSFNLQTGEQAYGHVVLSVDGGGWAFGSGIRAYLYRGVSVHARITIMRLNLPDSYSDFRNPMALEFGIGLLTPGFSQPSDRKDDS